MLFMWKWEAEPGGEGRCNDFFFKLLFVLIGGVESLKFPLHKHITVSFPC